ncbi:MAG TPA: GNAT family N-acetyltransferase [Egibacteraceae bacterium]|nr:GNAT family N-acetyltransferase [Egibacteraceae bacterium]
MSSEREQRPDWVASPIRPGQERAATDVLCAALADDPGWTHVIGDAAVRARVLQALIGVAVRDAARVGEVLTAEVDGQVAAVAVWLPPGTFPMTWQRRARGVLPVVALSLRAGRALREASRFGASIEAAFPDQPAWYLEILGVAPHAQRQGLGGALVRPMLARADREGVACYLETSNFDNVAYYEAHGFEVVVPGQPLYSGGPPMWTMLRPTEAHD